MDSVGRTSWKDGFAEEIEAVALSDLLHDSDYKVQSYQLLHLTNK